MVKWLGRQESVVIVGVRDLVLSLRFCFIQATFLFVVSPCV